jgi:large subunit ribosomal protein L6
MSRIGKLPIHIPSGVTITVDTDAITVVGPKGQLVVPHLSDVTVAIDEGKAVVTRKDDQRIAKAQHGLQRALLNNAVEGVTKAFEKKLEINGVGFRVEGGGKEINMALGFSHPVKYTASDCVNLELSNLLVKLQLKSEASKNLNLTRVKVLSMLTKLSFARLERQVNNHEYAR